MVVDDHAMVAIALSAALEGTHDIEVVGTAGTIEDAVAMAARLSPSVIVTDLALPEGEVVEHLDRFTEVAPGTRIVVMTGLPSERSFVAALRGGAVGYVSKTQPIEELASAVARVAAGDVVVPQQFLGALLTHGGPRTQPRSSAALTAREIDVVQLLALGRSTSQVADELHVAVNTVRNHLAGAMTKLDTSTRLAAVAEAIRLGLVSPPAPVATGR